MSPKPPSSAAADLSRRTILKAATAGGLLLGFRLRPLRALAAEAADHAVFAPNAFVRIGRDGKVTMIMPQVEMGQGTYTSMSMLIAEELEVDLAQVGLEAAPPDDRLYVNPLLGLQATGGSTSVPAMWLPLRRAGAAARIMLIEAAARQWRVDPASCHAQTGEVVRLFHPRRDIWSDHFGYLELDIVGVTVVGRTTASLLDMNDPERRRVRELVARIQS